MSKDGYKMSTRWGYRARDEFFTLIVGGMYSPLTISVKEQFMRSFSHKEHVSGSQWRYQRQPLRMAILFVIGLLVLTSLSFIPVNTIPRARAAAWNLIWSDEFNGSAGSGVDTSNWMYDTGTSYPGGAANWGTGEVETMTNSTSNVYQDGA